MNNEYSVCQFFVDGSYEYVRRFVNAENAIAAFTVYTHNPSASVGITQRVIITDGGDCTCAEWVFRKGITFPPQ